MLRNRCPATHATASGCTQGFLSVVLLKCLSETCDRNMQCKPWEFFVGKPWNTKTWFFMVGSWLLSDGVFVDDLRATEYTGEAGVSTFLHQVILQRTVV